MRDLTKHENSILQRVMRSVCPSCGASGEVNLTDTVTYTRVWFMHKDGIEKTDSDQSDATPYELRCRRCGKLLQVEEDVDITVGEFHELLDVKDASMLEDL